MFSLTLRGVDSFLKPGGLYSGAAGAARSNPSRSILETEAKKVGFREIMPCQF